MKKLKKFPFVKQHDAMDCGPACLSMVAKHYGRNYSLDYLRERSFLTREGVSMLGISDAAESMGATVGCIMSCKKLLYNFSLDEPQTYPIERSKNSKIKAPTLFTLQFKK